MFGTLGSFLFSRRRAVLVGWAALALLGGTLGGRVFDRLDDTDQVRPDAESQQAQRRLDQLTPTGPVVTAIVADVDPYDPDVVASVTGVTDRVRAVPGVVEVNDLYESAGGRIGADNRSTLVRVELAPGLPEREQDRRCAEVAALLRTVEAPTVLVGGERLARQAFAERSVTDAARGELVALAVLLVVLVLVLGGLTAALVPLGAALATVVTTLLAAYGLTTLLPVSEFTVSVVSLLGIGLAVDYALLLLVRYAQEREAAPTAEPSLLLTRAVAGAGPAVLTSGLAVGAAMTGLYAFADPLLAGMALGGAMAALVATATGLTLVPALVAVTHRHLRVARTPAWVTARTPAWVTALDQRLRPRGGRGRTDPENPRGGRRTGTTPEPLLGRLAALAQRRPKRVAIVVTGILLLFAAPFVLGVEVTDSDARSLPSSMEARRWYDTLDRDFAAGRAAPVVVVAEVDPASPEARTLLNRLTNLPGVLRVQPRPDVPAGSTVVDVTPGGTTTGRTAREVVRAIRHLNHPLLVGGPAAELVDRTADLAERLPLAGLVLLFSTVLLLGTLTGSLVIPVKATLLTALSLLATLGVLVVVFQWGWGARLLGLDPLGAIDVTTPVLLLVFGAALATDYEVFLLARIHEHWRSSPTAGPRGQASDRAVLAGIRGTGRVVTVAGACMVVVFLGFLLGGPTPLRELGFGMAVAVAIDVTVVRGLLLPALMTLLGAYNWWTPRALRRAGRTTRTTLPYGRYHD